MLRIVTCGILLLAVSTARAGEMDREGTPAKAPVAAKATTAAATEMDKESPTPAHWCCKYKHWGYGVGYYGGWGFGGFYPSFSIGFGYPGFYAPYYSGFYGYGRYFW